MYLTENLSNDLLPFLNLWYATELLHLRHLLTVTDNGIQSGLLFIHGDEANGWHWLSGMPAERKLCSRGISCNESSWWRWVMEKRKCSSIGILIVSSIAEALESLALANGAGGETRAHPSIYITRVKASNLGVTSTVHACPYISLPSAA